MFADKTAVVGLVFNNVKKKAFTWSRWTAGCGWQDKNLLLNISKTKELIVDFGEEAEESHPPQDQQGPCGGGRSFLYLGVHIIP